MIRNNNFFYVYLRHLLPNWVKFYSTQLALHTFYTHKKKLYYYIYFLSDFMRQKKCLYRVDKTFKITKNLKKNKNVILAEIKF